VRILLLRCRPDAETIGLQHVMLTEPLELEVLGALVHPPDEVLVVDLLLEKRPLAHFLGSFRPDLVGVGGYIVNVPAMKAACRQAHAFSPRVRTVVGGVHVEVCPEDLDDPDVDFRVVRNATTVFPRLLEHVRGGAPLPDCVLRPGEVVDRAALPAFDWSFPTPARHLVERYRHRYFYIFQDRVALVKSSFGCPYGCDFCFCREITGHAWHERPLDEVLEEIRALPQREIYLVDDDFLVSRERVAAFVAGVRSLDKRFLVYGRADFIAEHPDLIASFADAGLRTVIVGFESFSDTELSRYHKGTTASVNEAAMGVLRRLGVDCFATLILPPEWGREDFRACARKLRELGIRYVNLQPLTPLPGTGQRVADEDLLLSRQDYPSWDLAHVALRPRAMSEAEYYESIIETYLAALYRPGELLRLLRRYPPRLLGRMLLGTLRVQAQYRARTRRARRREEG
jgi:radical SAM superfamily enzyme YgiQ (UPF0313 family)